MFAGWRMIDWLVVGVRDRSVGWQVKGVRLCLLRVVNFFVALEGL